MTAAALRAQVEGRFSTARLTEITRPDDADYSTPDTTFLEYVCSDVIGELDLQGAGTYDDDDDAFVAVAVDGVVALAEYRLHPGSETKRAAWDAWLSRVGRLRGVRRHSRIRPIADDGATTTTQRFDRAAFRDHVPGKPGGPGGV